MVRQKNLATLESKKGTNSGGLRNRQQTVRQLLQAGQALAPVTPKGQRKPMAKMSLREIRKLAPRPPSPLPYLRLMVWLRRALRAELQRHVLDHLQVIAPGLRQDSADHFSNRFAHFEVSVGKLTSDSALRNRLKEIADGVQEHARGQLEKLHIVPVQKVDRSAEFVQENVELIRKMTSAQTSAMRDIVVEAVQGQASYKELQNQIEEQFGLSKARSELIAVDQTLKHNASVTEDLHRDAGVTKYVWVTSHDERVRGTPGGKWPRGNHYFLDGKTFDYNDPPVVDPKTGRRANPGKDYRCRCGAAPVVDDLLYAE